MRKPKVCKVTVSNHIHSCEVYDERIANKLFELISQYFRCQLYTIELDVGTNYEIDFIVDHLSDKDMANYEKVRDLLCQK